MKKILAATLILLGLTVTAQVQAQEHCEDFSPNRGWYVSGLGGLNLFYADKIHPLFYPKESIQLHAKRGYVVGGAIGYKFYTCTPLSYRVEAEVSYRRNNWKKIHSNRGDAHLNGYAGLTTYMLNGYVDLKCYFPFTPYIGAGIGYGTNHKVAKVRFNGTESPRGTRDSDGAVYQAIAGLGYQICNKWDMALEYRYLYLSGGFHNSQCNTVCFNLRKYF